MNVRAHFALLTCVLVIAACAGDGAAEPSPTAEAPAAEVPEPATEPAGEPTPTPTPEPRAEGDLEPATPPAAPTPTTEPAREPAADTHTPRSEDTTPEPAKPAEEPKPAAPRIDPVAERPAETRPTPSEPAPAIPVPHAEPPAPQPESRVAPVAPADAFAKIVAAVRVVPGRNDRYLVSRTMAAFEQPRIWERLEDCAKNGTTDAAQTAKDAAVIVAWAEKTDWTTNRRRSKDPATHDRFASDLAASARQLGIAALGSDLGVLKGLAASTFRSCTDCHATFR